MKFDFQRSPFLRPIFPSWRFFDQPGWIPKLEIRTDHLPWTLWQPRFKRNLFTLFRNGSGNLELAKISLLERLIEEAPLAASPEDFAESTTFKLTEVLAEDIARELDPSAHVFQFRVGLISQLAPSTEAEELLISCEREVTR